MAKTSRWFIALAASLLLLGIGVVGCGPKPPCEVMPTEVQAAQDECDAATAELDEAREERAELEAEVAETNAEIRELEGQPDELAARLHELRKGSGR